ncbi:diguanylate cyclase domain-containing protein [Paraliobacillus zengyii]|uniref:sensor domain-containing diguanylate cyclase n=1 Tax=Paraliobacillus zengyii TaxID=2213194 RepID=UPI000E3EA10A|nr:diguanylate cyclase [Paraliobacillus zengyii]
MKLRRSILPILFFIILTLQGCSNQLAESEYLANNGQLDLSKWHDTNSLIQLDGEWDFYWNQLLEPVDFINDPSIQPTGTISLPSNWHTTSVNGSSLPREGFATFQVSVTNMQDEVLGLMLPIMYSNYIIWIDDKPLAKSGQVGTNKDTSVAQKNTQVVYFAPEDNKFTITMQISNYDNAAGGMWESIKLGGFEAIHQSNSKKNFVQSILLGVLILSGIYHISLGLFRKTESYFLYFGLFCLVAGFRYLLVGEVFITKMFPMFDWDILMKLEYISLYSHVPLFGMVIYRLYPKESNRLFTLITIIVASIYALLTIFTNAKFYYHFLTYFQIFIIIGVLYVLFVAAKSLRNKRNEAVYLLVGIILLMASVLFDTFGFILAYPELNFYPIGIALFIISFSIVLSKRLSSSLELSVNLTKDLSKLNNELEAKVDQRTKQIQLANVKLEELNDKLKKMALIDGLTGIPNRRRFDAYYKEEYEICVREDKFLSLLFLDIDYFKDYNDYYGHQLGDECLKKIATELNSCITGLSEGIVARYGGEEFVCVLPNSNEIKAKKIAQELKERVEKIQISHVKSPVSKYVTLSIGLITVRPNSMINKNNILKQADQALYQAKTSGRNKISIFPNLQ